jgi:Fe-S-cluster containining protein
MDFKEKFFDITNLVQQEFDRNLELYGDKIKCGRGCSECCSQIFNITLLDGYIIQEHVKSLSSARQLELREKAKDYIEKKMLSSETSTGNSKMTDDERGFTDKPHIPCPALGSEGECTIYEARPVICRRFGMPIYDYKNPTRVHACHLNFKDGEEIIDTKLIPNQISIGMKWDELKEKYLSSHKKKVKGKGYTTIAESLLG